MKPFCTWWKKIPAKWRYELKSAWHTFLAAFVLAFSLQASQGDINWTADVIKSIGFAALRSAIKALFVWIPTQFNKPKPE